MQFFKLLGIEHIWMYFLPTLVFIVLVGLSLGYCHFESKDAKSRKETILYRFPEGIEDRNAPFPLGLFLLIAGTVLWGLFYILGIGLYKVVI